MRQIMLFLSLVLGISFCSPWALAQDQNGDVQRGEVIYQQHCLRCHGIHGKGEGPDAAYLIVPPANLLSEQSRLKTDLELLMVITHGSIFSPMHGWRDRLNENEIWDVLQYIRFLAPFKAFALAQ